MIETLLNVFLSSYVPLSYLVTKIGFEVYHFVFLPWKRTLSSLPQDRKTGSFVSGTSRLFQKTWNIRVRVAKINSTP